MKKIAFMMACAGLLGAVQAEDAVIQEEKASSDQVELENAKASFSGLYIGGGLNFMHMTSGLTWSDKFATTAGTIEGSYKTTDDSLKNKTKDHVGGTVVLGFGKKFDNIPFYIALEGMLDFNSHMTIIEKEFGWSDAFVTGVEEKIGCYIKSKRNGFIPSVGVRFAWANDALQSLLYLKLAANFTKENIKIYAESYNSTQELKEWQEFKNSKVGFEIGAGFEKRIDNLGLRAEGAYVIDSGSKDHSFTAKFTNSTYNVDLTRTLQHKKKGTIVFRVMAVMNFNLFK